MCKPFLPVLCWHTKTAYYAQSNANILCLSLLECNYDITCRYVIAADHVYAKSAELVHMKKSSNSLARLADSLLYSES